MPVYKYSMYDILRHSTNIKKYLRKAHIDIYLESAALSCGQAQPFLFIFNLVDFNIHTPVCQTGYYLPIFPSIVVY
jgi:hypothetical protein